MVRSIHELKNLSPIELQNGFAAEFVGQEREGVLCINFNLFGIPTGFMQLYVNLLNYIGSNQTLVFDGFYPHHEIDGLERIGIGTLAVIKGLDILLERGCVSFNHRVFQSPKLSQEYKLFLKRLGLNTEGLSLREYYNNAVEYASTKGFFFSKK